MKEALFAIFGIFTMAMAMCTVLSRNSVYSAFCLILSFFGLSAIYVLWGATFIAMIQILIYTGAIVVLFVFVVMLLNLGRGTGPHSNGWLTVIFSAGGVWLFAYLLLVSLNRVPSGPPTPNTLDNMRRVSLMLFNEYLWPFEVLSLFLLALIVAIYALTRPEEIEKEG